MKTGTDTNLKQKFNLNKLQALANRGRQYLWLLLLVFFLLLYGYLILEINTFTNAKPSALQIANDQKTTATPAINQKVVNQLEQLKDNSISVQALFNQARSNPFQ